MQLSPSTGCPVTYLDHSFDPSPVTVAYSNYEGQDAQINGTLLAIRTYRQAFGDTAGSATADASATARILDYVGGSWNRTLFANRPMNWIKYP